MRWAPCQRIVPAGVPPALRLRGLSPCVSISWPDAYLNSGADFSVDFSRLLCCSGRITQAAVQLDGGSVAWVSIYGNLVTFWAVWSVSGMQSITVTAQSDMGETISICAAIRVLSLTALLPPIEPDYAPNAFLLSNSVYVQDATGTQPLVMG